MKVYVCCDCEIATETEPEKCICGSLCFTTEEV